MYADGMYCSSGLRHGSCIAWVIELYTYHLPSTALNTMPRAKGDEEDPHGISSRENVEQFQRKTRRYLFVLLFCCSAILLYSCCE